MSSLLRQLPLLLASLILAACTAASIVAPPHPATEPRLTADNILTEDGMTLPLQRWLPEGEPKAVVLALHGINDYANFCDAAATVLAHDGVAVFAYDQRGFGRTRSRGRWAGGEQLAADARLALVLLRARYPHTPLYLLGESMGGAVAILAASGNAPGTDLDGLILVAPAVWGRPTMGLLERVGLVIADLTPGITWSPRLIQGMYHPSDNYPMLRAYSADPLVIKDSRSEVLAGVARLMTSALEAGPRLDLPLLLLYGEHDDIVPAKAMKHFVAELPPAAGSRQRVAFYPDGYHMLMRDLEGPLVIGDVGTWIADRGKPLPSGFDRDAVARLLGRKPTVAAR